MCKNIALCAIDKRLPFARQQSSASFIQYNHKLYYNKYFDFVDLHTCSINFVSNSFYLLKIKHLTSKYALIKSSKY